MAGEQIEIIIDANGLARTEQVFRSLDRYMERLHVRASRLARMQIRPVIQLIDRVTEPLERIKNALQAISSTDWTPLIELNPKMDSAVFALKGTEAGKAFADSFLAEFDSDKLADKVKQSLEGVSVDVNVNPSESSGNSFGTLLSTIVLGAAGSGVWAGIAKYGPRIISSLGTIVTKGIAKFKPPVIAPPPSNGGVTKVQQKKIDKATRKQGSSGKKESKRKQGSSKRSNENKSDSGKRNNAQRVKGKKANTARPSVPDASKVPEPKGSKFGRVLGLGKKVLSKFGGAKVNSIVGLSAVSSSGILGSSPIGKGTAKAAGSIAKTALKIGGKAFAPLGLATRAISIFSAKPGKERNKAIGGALGGWGGAAAGAAAGAAIGSVIPGIGTAIGGVVGGAIGGLSGSAVGEKIGELATKASDTIKDMGGKLKGFFFGSKKKEKEPNPVALPTPAPVYSVGSSQPTSVPTSVPISVNVPYGAIQITVNSADIDYEQISNRIGGQLASSIQQAVENRV
ncbi:hypothetical protein J4772_30065 [Cohnella sp. LGH]|uniref:hypothetical protein n=1 Tax=Cohnella sp. LGH TaxID=1619153 RepID=UPI001ADC7220|nr:hypothetical protein [Cohnella sp. LGH]QTH41731.1 hypothetical protein J4772_30065 [Cohnella sp. LGH]